MKELKIEIIKSDGNVKIEHTESADIHEVVGVLAVTLNHLTLQAHGVDLEKVFNSLE